MSTTTPVAGDGHDHACARRVEPVEPRCNLDPTRACGGCSAAGPDECPYVWLLDGDVLWTTTGLVLRDA